MFIEVLSKLKRNIKYFALINIYLSLCFRYGDVQRVQILAQKWIYWLVHKHNVAICVYFINGLFLLLLFQASVINYQFSFILVQLYLLFENELNHRYCFLLYNFQ